MEKKYNYIRKTEVFEGHRYEGTGKTEAEAYKKLHAKIEAAKRGELSTSKNMTVETWTKVWLETYVEPRIREPGKKKTRGTMNQHSYDSRERILRNYLLPEIGKVRLKSVTPAMLQKVINKDKDQSYSHVQKLKIAIQQLFKQAWIDKKIVFDPAANLEMPATEQNKRRALTDEEKVFFFKAAQKNKYGLLFRFFLATGVRPNELVALRAEDINLEEKTVYVHNAVEAGTNIIGTPKTGAGVRYTLINDLTDTNIIDDLKRHLDGKESGSFAFVSSKGMMTKSALRNCWVSFSRDMDIEMGAEMTRRGHIYDPTDLDEQGRPIYPDPKDPTQPRNGHKISPDLCVYCLRHTFGTDMQRAGVPINQTRYMMGHTNINTTAMFYIDTGKEDVIQVAKELAEKKKAVARKKSSV